MKWAKLSTHRKILFIIYLTIAIGLLIVSVATLLGHENRLLWALLSIANAPFLFISLYYAADKREKQKKSDFADKEKQGKE